MKKFAKMSLVAAVAVAGMTSASAADLAEAIKGVDVSGQFRYRVQDISSQTAGTKTSNGNSTDVEVEVTAKIPVNDNVTAVIKVDNANDDADTVTKGDVTIEDYYFQYVNGAVTVNYGQQNIPGRITDGAQGDGIVALYNAGDFTVGAAAFITNNLVDTVVNGSSTAPDTTWQQNDVYSVIAMGNIGPVSLLGQYATAVDVADTYNLKADAKVGPVMVGVEYTETELDNVAATALNLTASKEDRDTFKAYISGSIEALSAKLTYASTGKNGPGSLDNQLTANSETPAEFLLWQLSSASKTDLSLVAIDASYALTDKVSLRAAYADGDTKASGVTTDHTEALGQISYKMSSNLNTYFRISEYETEASGSKTESTRGRVEVQYTF